ncbi:MAG: Maf family protein [Gemmatimonadota bacterium]
MTLVLASASPRRAEILRTLGFIFQVAPSDADETVLSGESPGAHAERLARTKAESAARRYAAAHVLAGDTVVTLDGEILGKPRDDDDAVRMLLRLQGRSHDVVSALALGLPPGEGSLGRRTLAGIEVTAVNFRPFGRAFAEAYVATGEPLDKAGAYGIQGMGAALVERIQGDYTAVVGLPVPLLLRLMEQGGLPYRFGAVGD